MTICNHESLDANMYLRMQYTTTVQCRQSASRHFITNWRKGY